ncbi:hypothetical protein ACLOJK_030695 [Asimina triloba]
MESEMDESLRWKIGRKQPLLIGDGSARKLPPKFPTFPSHVILIPDIEETEISVPSLGLVEEVFRLLKLGNVPD